MVAAPSVPGVRGRTPRVTAAEAQLMRDLRAAGHTITEIARVTRRSTVTVWRWLPKREPPPTVCAVPGCGRPHHGRGLCRRCYTRAREAGRLPGMTFCSVDGCDRAHRAHGLCQVHYRRQVSPAG